MTSGTESIYSCVVVVTSRQVQVVLKMPIQIVELGDRPMVGHAALDRSIGVRIPVPQLIFILHPFCYVVEGFSVCDIYTSAIQ